MIAIDFCVRSSNVYTIWAWCAISRDLTSDLPSRKLRIFTHVRNCCPQRRSQIWPNTVELAWLGNYLTARTTKETWFELVSSQLRSTKTQTMRQYFVVVVVFLLSTCSASAPPFRQLSFCLTKPNRSDRDLCSTICFVSYLQAWSCSSFGLLTSCDCWAEFLAAFLSFLAALAVAPPPPPPCRAKISFLKRPMLRSLDFSSSSCGVKKTNIMFKMIVNISSN